MTQDDKNAISETIIKHNKFEGYGRLYLALGLDKKFYLCHLMPREIKILQMRFGFEDGITHTLEEVGKKFGITRERVREIQTKALEQIKNKLSCSEIPNN